MRDNGIIIEVQAISNSNAGRCRGMQVVKGVRRILGTPRKLFSKRVEESRGVTNIFGGYNRGGDTNIISQLNRSNIN